MTAKRYRAEIDGLRAVAVIPVVAFHFGASLVPGGFVGVDVFFVISGFLITRLILSEREGEGFSLKEFWARRVRRLLPAMLVVLASTALAGWLLLNSVETRSLGRQGIATLLSLANVFFWRGAGDYWGTAAESSPLLHAWSLSVEEQFYLLFPLLLLVSIRWLRSRWVWALGACVLLSFAAFLYGCRFHPTATFYSLPTRAWEIGLGCVLAGFASNQRSRIPEWEFPHKSGWVWLGLALIAGSCLFIPERTTVSPFLLGPVLGTALVIAFSGGAACAPTRLLQLRPVVYLGKLSYSLYLWHWPIFVLSQSVPGFEQVPLGPLWLTLLSLALSVASYHFVEQRTRRRAGVLGWIGLGYALVFGSLIALTQAPDEDISMFEPTQWRGSIYNLAPQRVIPEGSREVRRGIEIAAIKSQSSGAYATGGVRGGAGAGAPELVLLGDSHALMWASTVDELCREARLRAVFYAASGVPTFPALPVERRGATTFFSSEQRFAFDRARVQLLEQSRPKIVLIAVRWEHLRGAEAQPLLEFLGELGASVFLIEQPPLAFAKEVNAPRTLSHRGLVPRPEAPEGYLPAPPQARWLRGQRLVRELADRYPHCQVISVADLFLRGEEVWVRSGRQVLYIDDDHLSEAGVSKVKDRLRETLRAHLAR